MSARQERRLDTAQTPGEFRAALTQIENARLRQELRVEEMPAPQRIAPHATALAADIVSEGEEIGGGRLVVLFDPDGNDAWEGTFRCVAYARADLDPELAADPVLASVGWSWLMEALETNEAEFAVPSGTVTCVSSESFGGLAEEGATAQIELRASWTPLGDLTAHVEAWGQLLCTAAGLPPVPDGVSVLPNRPERSGRHGQG